MTWMGDAGFGDAITCRRDWLHDNIPGEYLHKKKTDTSDRIKVAHFFNPVVAVRHLEAVIEKTIDANVNDAEKEVGKSYQCVYDSFQSISPCNFSTTNALNK